jgi:hypothetical protein
MPTRPVSSAASCRNFVGYFPVSLTIRRYSRPGVALLVLACAAVAEAQLPPTQQEIAQGYLPYRRLTAADFPIRDNAPSPHGMYTYGFRHYNYRSATERRPDGRFSARVTEWVVRAGFNRNKSWRKSWFKRVEELLPHEQGHLDISLLHSVPFARMSLIELPIGEGSTAKAAEDDLKKKLEALLQRVTKGAQAEQDAYDAATSHGENRMRQQEWSAKINRRLREAGISYSQ